MPNDTNPSHPSHALLPSRLLVLMAHGSRDARWREPFETLQQEMQEEMGSTGKVALAYMEMAEPHLEAVVKQALEADATLSKVVIWPLLMAAGAHFSTDIQEQTAALKTQFPQLAVELLPPVGEHPALRKLLVYLAEEALGGTLLNEDTSDDETDLDKSLNTGEKPEATVI